MSGENIAIHPTMKIQDIIFRPTGGKMAKYAWRNRGVRYTYSELAQDLVQRWLHSPGHRRNILSRHFKYLGVGCARGIFNDLDVFLCDAELFFYKFLKPWTDILADNCISPDNRLCIF